MPSPPARVLIKYTKCCESSWLYCRMSTARCTRFVDPSNRECLYPRSLRKSDRMSSIEVNCENTTTRWPASRPAPLAPSPPPPPLTHPLRRASSAAGPAFPASPRQSQYPPSWTRRTLAPRVSPPARPRPPQRNQPGSAPSNRYGWLQHFLSCIMRDCSRFQSLTLLRLSSSSVPSPSPTTAASTLSSSSAS
jgi:hypothetical protein